MSLFKFYSINKQTIYQDAALLKYTLLVLIAAGSFFLDEGDSLQLASQTTPVLDDPARVRSESDESALITWQTAADRGGAAPGETKPGSWGRVRSGAGG